MARKLRIEYPGAVSQVLDRGTPEPNLVAGVQWLQGTYSIRFDCRRELCGHAAYYPV